MSDTLYLPDMARIAPVLAERRATLPAHADVPFAGFTLSMADLARAITRLTGQPVRITGFMWWAMRLTAPFWELARELLEMLYLWNTSHSLDPAPLAALMPDFRPTPLDEVLRQELVVLAPGLANPQGRLITAQTGR